MVVGPWSDRRTTILASPAPRRGGWSGVFRMFSGGLAAPDRRSRRIDRASWRAEHAMLGRGLPEHRIASVKSAPGRRLLRVVSIVRTRKSADPNIGSNPQISADPPTGHRCIWEFPAPEGDDARPPHERPQPSNRQ